jgi:hypothetical protein
MKEDILVAIVVIERVDNKDTSTQDAQTSGGSRSRGPSRAYDTGWDRTFGNKASRPQDMN